MAHHYDSKDTNELRPDQHVRWTKADVDKLDLSPVAAALCGELTETELEAGLEDYRCFLTLLLLYPHDELVPTAPIDEFWKAHIVQTAKYAADCKDLTPNRRDNHFLHRSMPSSVVARVAAEKRLDYLSRRHFKRRLLPHVPATPFDANGVSC